MAYDFVLTLRVWADSEKDAESIAVQFLGLRNTRGIPPLIVDIVTKPAEKEHLT